MTRSAEQNEVLQTCLYVPIMLRTTQVIEVLPQDITV